MGKSDTKTEQLCNYVLNKKFTKVKVDILELCTDLAVGVGYLSNVYIFETICIINPHLGNKNPYRLFEN